MGDSSFVPKQGPKAVDVHEVSNLDVISLLQCRTLPIHILIPFDQLQVGTVSRSGTTNATPVIDLTVFASKDIFSTCSDFSATAIRALAAAFASSPIIFSLDGLSFTVS